MGEMLLRPLVSPRVSPSASPFALAVGWSSQSVGVGGSAEPVVFLLAWPTLDTAYGGSCACPTPCRSSSKARKVQSFSSWSTARSVAIEASRSCYSNFRRYGGPKTLPLTLDSWLPHSTTGSRDRSKRSVGGDAVRSMYSVMSKSSNRTPRATFGAPAS